MVSAELGLLTKDIDSSMLGLLLVSTTVHQVIEIRFLLLNNFISMQNHY